MFQAFHESDEGREFLKRMSQVRRSRAHLASTSFRFVWWAGVAPFSLVTLPERCAVAKDKHLAGVQVPKKPPGALDLYGREKVKELKKDRGLGWRTCCPCAIPESSLMCWREKSLVCTAMGDQACGSRRRSPSSRELT